MKRYLLNVYQPDGDPLPPQELRKVMADVGKWQHELRSAGAWVFDAGLYPASTATVVRPEGDEMIITDGPFIEAKEHIGGFTIIKVPDLDAALAWGRKLTVATTLPTEVWPMEGEAED
jgi:hypothetical protein